MGSTSLQSQYLLHKVGGNARPKQDGGNDDVELNLNLLHPALATLQLFLNRLVPLIANRLVDGEFLFDGLAHDSSAGNGVLPSASHFR